MAGSAQAFGSAAGLVCGRSGDLHIFTLKKAQARSGAPHFQVQARSGAPHFHARRGTRSGALAHFSLCRGTYLQNVPTTIVNAHFWAAFILILRRQNQRFETLIQNADPKRRSREYCSCFPQEKDDFVSMHCALFEAFI